MVLCDDTLAARLAADPRVAFVTFIGSARVGWRLRSRLAPGAACVLEHGGVAPAIVDPSADLADAVPLLVKGGYYHAGQVCVSVQRIFVHSSIEQRFLDAFAAQVRALRVGDPLDVATDVGPLILPREVDRVEAWVREATDAGARLLCGGQRLSRTSFAPTLLYDPPTDARVSREEVFGPVVAVYPYDDIETAIRRANDVDASFQASLFTRDLATALSVSRRLNGLAVMVNDHSAFRVDSMPFGGHKSSGLGVGGIGYAIRDMTLERLVVFRSPEP
jgi:acyl-CoA reductase-like NAD-dependent aldehyde dehydrogenase